MQASDFVLLFYVKGLAIHSRTGKEEPGNMPVKSNQRKAGSSEFVLVRTVSDLDRRGAVNS